MTPIIPQCGRDGLKVEADAEEEKEALTWICALAKTQSPL